MPIGLETFDENEVTILDPTNSVARVLGVITVSSNGSLTNDDFLTGIPYASCMGTLSSTRLYDIMFGSTARVTFSGNKMTWIASQAATIFYGVR